jgi:hypothetical protein
MHILADGWIPRRLLYYPVNGLEIIALHLEVADLAVPLGSGDPSVPQQVLDCREIRVGVE